MLMKMWTFLEEFICRLNGDLNIYQPALTGVIFSITKKHKPRRGGKPRSHSLNSNKSVSCHAWHIQLNMAYTGLNKGENLHYLSCLFFFFFNLGYISPHNQIVFSGWMGGVKSSKSFCLWLLQFKPLTVGKPLSVSTIGITTIFGLFQGKQNTGRHPRDTGSSHRIVFLHFWQHNYFYF